MIDQLEAAVLDAAEMGRGRAAAGLGKGEAGPRRRIAVRRRPQPRHQALAFEPGHRTVGGEPLLQGDVEVDQLHRDAHPTASRQGLRIGDHERHVDSVVVGQAPVVEEVAVLAEALAVVGGEDHQRVVEEPQLAGVA